MIKLLHLSAECYPIAKVGGLADVVGALPKYQEASGITSQVLMPYYNTNFVKENTFSTVKEGVVQIGNQNFSYNVLSLSQDILGFTLFLVKIDQLTDREKVYGYPDDTERFVAFQKVAADFISDMEQKPSVVHCHDHHTGLVPFFMNYAYKYDSLKKIPTVLTIHNAQYQGQFKYEKLHYLPDFDHQHIGVLDWDGQINPLATAIKCAWKVTTVSPSYLEELQQHANGLENLLKHEHHKSIGILNGIDPQVWNPSTDKYLKKNYNLVNIQSGKKANKEWLCKQFGLNPELPLISFIGRFVYEKGSDLLPQVVQNVFRNLNLEVSLLVLGSGNDETTRQLNEIRSEFAANYNTYIGYNEELSHIIYAGSDFLLMPSRVEPCGLNQMYSLRYGTMPIVSNKGGLKDTIVDIDEGTDGVGIVCKEVSVHEISFAIQRAVDVYVNTSFYKEKRKKIMKIDHSWDKSALDYINLYKSLLSI